jgi:hypothetical protein
MALLGRQAPETKIVILSLRALKARRRSPKMDGDILHIACRNFSFIQHGNTPPACASGPPLPYSATSSAGFSLRWVQTMRPETLS